MTKKMQDEIKAILERTLNVQVASLEDINLETCYFSVVGLDAAVEEIADLIETRYLTAVAADLVKTMAEEGDDDGHMVAVLETSRHGYRSLR